MTDTQIIVTLQLVFGSGIIIVLLRLMFVLGQYAQRVDTMDKAIEKLDVAVESLREDLNHFRERRVSATTDRRALHPS